MVSSDGTVYVSDTDNNRIRGIAPNGRVTTLIGNGLAGDDDSDAYWQVTFNKPQGITLGNNGELLVVDSGNHKIRCGNTAVSIPALCAHNEIIHALVGLAGPEWQQDAK